MRAILANASRLLLMLAAPAALGCGSSGAPKPSGGRVAGDTSEASAGISRIELELADVSGLSGLTIDRGNRLWSVPERGAMLVSFDADGGDIRETAISGITPGTDLESLAYVSDGRFFAGGEHRDARGYDEIMLIESDGDGARVVDSLRIEYQRWGTSGVGNQGLEGLCAAGGTVIAAVETTTGVGSERAAPLAIVDVESRTYKAIELKLTTATGKISALDCWPGASGIIDVIAIERHFEIARVLEFSIDVATVRAGAIIRPELVVDWSDRKRKLDNPEGLVRLSSGALAIIGDNDFGGAEGPNTLFLVDL